MSLLSDGERTLAEALSGLTACNPFRPERMELERQALGEAFVASGPVWHLREGEPPNPNECRLSESAERLAASLHSRLAAGTRASRRELELYGDLIAYLLYYRYEKQLYAALTAAAGVRRVAAYQTFVADLERFCQLPGRRLEPPLPASHLFACFFQVRRAFHHVFGAFVGVSAPAARLRAEVWESIFTSDMRRYRRALYARMGDVTTLVVGPSGTGKELVARAVGLSRYIPFEPQRATFEESPASSFAPLNLAALSPTLIESELFGHCRGAFTGAVGERAGWLEVCPPLGTVFLDEIAEIEPAIQVKLLRVLETRSFQRLGETRERSFRGKLIAATNRDLGAELRERRFREDLYYRLCADTITTPSLRERLRDTPEELALLVGFLAQRLVGEEESPALAREVVAWIDTHLGPDYPWPGNVRELAQCVSNVLIRGSYQPARESAAGPRQRLLAELAGGALTAEEALGRYCTLVYADAGSYLLAARRLGVDRRTVRSRIDPALAQALRREG
ncbi:MAG TPA: sigma 54-interacting transcriptional regulator [Thermoanaerobaculia bacterium]|jgi:hypothetical protein|nr:sigma 54-interacting transcriptional regulator [Thermoanaerobaculia bacterium]